MQAVQPLPGSIAKPPRQTRDACTKCLHCANDLAPGESGPFCCTGCEAVYGLLKDNGLERYYELRGESESPAREAGGQAHEALWLEPFVAKLRAAKGPERIQLDIQGMHCSACVWLVDRLFERKAGALRVTVNPAIGRVDVLATPSFDLAGFVAEIERFGYRLGPPLKESSTRSNDLLVRMGVCIALAMNAMIFAIAAYAGLTEGPTQILFERVTLGISILSVVVGGPVFFRSAWASLRARVLHLDLPIALGIVLAFVGSIVSFFAKRPSGVFVDTLDVFLALMLVGRFLQERVLEKNRLALLASDGVDGLLTRKLVGGKITTTKATSVAAGDHLKLATGEVVPVDSRALAAARFSLDWVNGESTPRNFDEGDIVPAGAFSASEGLVELEATTDFGVSPLVALLRNPEPRARDKAMSEPFWDRVARIYVVAVLAAAAIGFFGWLLIMHDLPRAVEVATAVLVVTCPCAFGIATPLGYDLAQGGLRKAGLYVRSAGFLDRAASVRTVVFDKTGTLTLGKLGVRASHEVRPLDTTARARLVEACAANGHPKATAIREWAERAGFTSEAGLEPGTVHEVPGKGLELATREGIYRFGLPAWAAPGETICNDVCFARDDAALAWFETEEALRADARDEIRALREEGYDVWLLSGDEAARTAQTARFAGIPEDHAVGGATPTAKADWVAAHDREDLLMIGDGINDSLVVERAFCGGTPAVDRPFMAARSDFYFTTPGLGCIRLALRVGKAVTQVRRRNLVIAVAYNLLCVGLAYAGLLSPLACAVLMPVSSLTTILGTSVTLSSKSPLWKSSPSKSS